MNLRDQWLRASASSFSYLRCLRDLITGRLNVFF